MLAYDSFTGSMTGLHLIGEDVGQMTGDAEELAWRRHGFPTPQFSRCPVVRD